MIAEHIKNAYLPVVKRPDTMNDNLSSPSEQNKDPLKVDRSERIQLVKVANERERDKRSKCSVPRPIDDLRRDADSQTDGHVASHDV